MLRTVAQQTGYLNVADGEAYTHTRANPAVSTTTALAACVRAHEVGDVRPGSSVTRQPRTRSGDTARLFSKWMKPFSGEPASRMAVKCLEQHGCAIPVYNIDREASGHGLSAETAPSLTGFAIRLSVGGGPERSCDSYIVSSFTC